MAAFEAFESCFPELVTEVSESVKSVADACRGAFIIGPDTYEIVVQTSSTTTKSDKARTLLMEVSSRISSQTNEGEDSSSEAFEKFVTILKKERSLTNIALKMEESLAAVLERARLGACTEDVQAGNVEGGDSGVADMSASTSYREPGNDLLGPNEVPDVPMASGYSTNETIEGAHGTNLLHIQGGSGQSPSSHNVREENLDLKATNAEQEVKIKQLEEELETTTHDKNEFARKLKEAEKKLQVQSEKNSQHVAALKKHIAALKEKAASKEKENASQKEKYKAEIQKLTEQLEKNEALYNKNIVTLTEEKCDLLLKVKEFERQEEKLKKEIEMAKREAAEIGRDLAEAKQQIAESSVKEMAKEMELNRLKSEAKNKEYEDLIKQLKVELILKDE